MYSYEWDPESGGLLLKYSEEKFSKEPRPVYYKELDLLGFDKYWNYEKDDSKPYMWAEMNSYIYKGRLVAKTKGGSLYTKPEIIIVEEPEPDGSPLSFVDIDLMCEKNRETMDKISNSARQDIFNTYNEHRDKVDVFYVAFSGGKDSVVTLDLVQNALPHNSFKVIFGDTGMEFPDTYKAVERIEEYCRDLNIEFLRSKAEFDPDRSWDLFGPPARKVRWCCTVHKTAPVINKLAEVMKLQRLCSMMITGVRKDESVSRSSYEKLSKGKKIKGQYSFHPILDWSSAEIYIYMFIHNLQINEAYKYGFNRVGCIMCPNSSEKHEYMKNKCYPDKVEFYCDKIAENTIKDLSGDNRKIFLETGGWKGRLSGRELKNTPSERVVFKETAKFYEFSVKNLKQDWITWFKTIGNIYKRNSGELIFDYKNLKRSCNLSENENISVFKIEKLKKTKNEIEFIRYFRVILIKSQYCIYCKTCPAECHSRNIDMNNGILSISDSCSRCHSCLDIQNGCVYYNSIKGSNSMTNIKGINRYLSVGVEYSWIKEYMNDQTFEPGNRKTDVMHAFLLDAGITLKRKMTPFGMLINSIGLYDNISWALIICNLAYSSAFKWYIRNIEDTVEWEQLRDNVIPKDSDEKFEKTAKKALGEFWNGFKVIFDTNRYFQAIGFGIPEIEEKSQESGLVKKTMRAISRFEWSDPDPRVILYSLYKYAEKNGVNQFSFSSLYEEIDEENEGISPYEIFKIGRDSMEKILNSLSVNYPEFINASFTLDLDVINLRDDKTSADVLTLFKERN